MARIVIAEDEGYLRNVLAACIARGGHDVVAAPDGQAALECLQAQPAEILVTDVRMPRMDGIELTRLALAACPSLRRVFVVTAVWDQQEILRQLPDPRVRVFPKPFSPSELLRELDLIAGTPASRVASPDPAPRGLP